MAYGLTQSALLNGTNQSFSRAKTGSSNLYASGAQNFTMEGWFKFTSLPASGGVWALYSQSWMTSGNLSFTIQIDNTGGTYGIRVRLSSDGTAVTNLVVATFAFTTATWYHIAAVYTAASGKVEIFVNGTSVASSTSYPTSIFNGTDAVYIGSEDGSASLLPGNASLVRFWKEARTGAQITSNLCSVLGSTTNLGGEWTLNNTVNDNSGNSNTLTNNNSVTFPLDIPSTCIPTATSSSFLTFM